MFKDLIVQKKNSAIYTNDYDIQEDVKSMLSLLREIQNAGVGVGASEQRVNASGDVNN